MKATGIIRRIDDLGRVVIPKEIRKKLKKETKRDQILETNCKKGFRDRVLVYKMLITNRKII